MTISTSLHKSMYNYNYFALNAFNVIACSPQSSHFLCTFPAYHFLLAINFLIFDKL